MTIKSLTLAITILATSGLSLFAQETQSWILKIGIARTGLRQTDYTPIVINGMTLSSSVADDPTFEPSIAVAAVLSELDYGSIVAQLSWLNKSTRFHQDITFNTGVAGEIPDRHIYNSKFQCQYLELGLLLQPSISLADLNAHLIIGPKFSYRLDVVGFPLDRARTSPFLGGYLLGAGVSVTATETARFVAEISYSADFAPFSNVSNYKLWHTVWLLSAGISI